MTKKQFKADNLTGLVRGNGLYGLLITIFLTMIVMQDQFAIAVPSLAFTAIWLLIILLFDQQRAAAFTVSVAICFASTLSVTIPIAAFVVSAWLRSTRRVYIGVIMSAALLIAAEATQFLSDAAQDFRTFVNVSMFIVLVATVVTMYWDRPYDPVGILKHYIGFYVFLSLDIFIFTVRGFGSVSAIWSDSFRIGQTDLVEGAADSVAMSINANGMAFLSLMAIAISLVLMQQRHLTKKVALPLIVYASFIGAMTISKTFVLCYLALLLLYYFWSFIANSKNLLIAIGLALVIGVALYAFSFTEIYQNIANRFENSDLTTGRTEIIAQYLDYMRLHPDKILFGIGLQNTNVKAGFETVPHNAILETFVCLGLVGIFSAIVLVYCLFRGSRRTYIERQGRTPSFLNYIPLLVYLLFIQTFQFIKISYIFIPLSLAMLCILIKPRETEKSE